LTISGIYYIIPDITLNRKDEQMTKYDAHDHIAVLTELNVLYKFANETQTKILEANERLKKIKEAKAGEDEIPF
jgi:hypothetical protein